MESARAHYIHQIVLIILYYLIFYTQDGDTHYGHSYEDDVCESLTSFTIGSDSADFVSSFDFDETGHMYLGGRTEGAMFDEDPGGTDPIVLKLRVEDKVVYGPEWGWQPRTWGKDDILSIAVGRPDEVYVAGWVVGNVEGKSGGGKDAWVAKITSKEENKKKWGRQWGAHYDEKATSISYDGSGNVVACGNAFTGIFQQENHAGSKDPWAVKLNGTDGTELWHWQDGSPEDDDAQSCTFDEFGDVYIAGSTKGSLHAENGGGADAWTIKLSGSTGDRIWGWQEGSLGDDNSYSIKVHQGKVYLSGTTSGDFFTENENGVKDLWAVRLDAVGGEREMGFQAGNHLDSQMHGGTTMAVSSDGSLYITGDTSSETYHESLGLPDVWLAKVSSSGKLVWAWQMPGAGLEKAGAVRFHDNKELYLVGSSTEGRHQGGFYDIFVNRISCPEFETVPEMVSPRAALDVIISLSVVSLGSCCCIAYVWIRGLKKMKSQIQHGVQNITSYAAWSRPKHGLDDDDFFELNQYDEDFYPQKAKQKTHSLQNDGKRDFQRKRWGQKKQPIGKFTGTSTQNEDSLPNAAKKDPEWKHLLRDFPENNEEQDISLKKGQQEIDPLSLLPQKDEPKSKTLKDMIDEIENQTPERKSRSKLGSHLNTKKLLKAVIPKIKRNKYSVEYDDADSDSSEELPSIIVRKSGRDENSLASIFSPRESRGSQNKRHSKSPKKKYSKDSMDEEELPSIIARKDFETPC